MNFKPLLFFFFSISLISSYSISQSNPFPANIVFGTTYNTTFTITTLGPSSTAIFFDMTGISSPIEMNLTMDGAICSYSTLWVCTYNQSSSGVYQTSMHMTTNPFLDPSANYSYRLDYTASEDVPTSTSTPSRSYYSSSGGGSFAPRPQYKPTPPTPVKNETITAPVPPKPPTPIVIDLTQSNTTNETEFVINNSDVVIDMNQWPVYEIKEIELIEADEPKTDDSWIYLFAFGLLVVGIVVYAVYLIFLKRRMS